MKTYKHCFRALEALLSKEDESTRRKVARLIQSFQRKAQSMEAVDNPTHHVYFLHLLRKDVLNNIIDMKLNLPVQTHLTAVIVAYYRRALSKVRTGETRYEKAS